MEKEVKIPFFKKVIMSIKDLDKYNLLATEKIGRSILYFFKIMLIFAVILSAALTYKASTVINSACDYMKNDMPDFRVEDNKLILDTDTPVIVENNQIVTLKIILDDKATLETYENELNDYEGNLFIAMQDKVLIFASGQQISKTYEEIKKDYNIEELNKTTVLNKFNENQSTIYIGIYFTIFGMIFLLYTFSTLIDMIALAILSFIISRMARLSLSVVQNINIAISALTLPIILNIVYSTVNILTGFYMSYFQIMYTIISYIYIVAVILIMRNDLIKKKQLIKATIEVKKMEKQMETKDDENTDNKKEEKKEKEEPDDENTIGKVKDKVKGKLKEDKDNPEPQANIEGGKQ